jgi:hypothetical protein
MAVVAIKRDPYEICDCLMGRMDGDSSVTRLYLLTALRVKINSLLGKDTEIITQCLGDYAACSLAKMYQKHGYDTRVDSPIFDFNEYIYIRKHSDKRGSRSSFDKLKSDVPLWGYKHV